MTDSNINTSTKQSYIEFIRAFAAITVVFLHIVMTLPANYSIEELGTFNSIVFNACYMPTKWAVPCFVMVSGALLLNPSKTIGYTKTAKYLARMIWVLLIFGTVFSLMELVFSGKRIDVLLPLKALLNVAEGKSWDHLWYIYTLIALYLVTPFFKIAINHISQKEFDILVYILMIGNFLIPYINFIFKLEIKNFMIIPEYATYYLIGYWITTKENICKKKIIIPGIVATIAMIIIEIHSISSNGVVFEANHSSKDLLTLIQSVSVFMFFKEFCFNKRIGKLLDLICKCSFGIYIIHPFWINMLYKVIKFTPLTMNIGIGILVCFIVVFVLSFVTTLIMKRIPFINKIV